MLVSFNACSVPGEVLDTLGFTISFDPHQSFVKYVS